MRTSLLLATILVLTACGSIEHTRDIVVNGQVVGREREAAKAFLMKGALEKVRSATKDGPYSHSLSASGVEGAGDVDMIKAIGSEVRQGFQAGAVAASRGVVP